jgi:hypothetical protein
MRAVILHGWIQARETVDGGGRVETNPLAFRRSHSRSLK